MIDKKSVKDFWDSRAKTYGKLPFESIANLEQDPQFLELKMRLESEKVFGWMGDLTGLKVLDLGAGVGQWTFRFQERRARSVTAVEYSKPLADIGREKVSKDKIDNIEFVVSPAEEFRTQSTFDVIFISGLFVYLNDDQASLLVDNLPAACGPDTVIFLRDGTGRSERYLIDNKPSEHLGTNYSAIYRTKEEYQALFDRMGFDLIKDENMFDEGVPLNKYPETRLRLYQFVRKT